VNERTENIGARRLHTVMERLLETVSFEAADRGSEKTVVDAAYVDQHLGSLVDNEDLARCPLIFADEHLGGKRSSNQDITTTLREVIGSLTRTLDRKYRAPIDLVGAVRLILAANNKSLLDSRDVVGFDDINAIAKRFLHIPVSLRAVEIMERLPEHEVIEWGNRGIASHVLWLSENHRVENKGRRFWVEGEMGDMHRILSSSSRINALVSQCLVRYLMAPQAFDRAGSGLVRCGGGKLFVNAQAVIDMWENYLTTKVEPELKKINDALRAIAVTAQQPRLSFGGKRIRYHNIDVDHLMVYSDREGLGDRDEILARVQEGEDPSTGKAMAGVPTVNDAEAPF